MAKVVDAKTATLEHFQFIVEAFDKTTILPVAKIIRNQIQPGIQKLQEWLEAGQGTGLNLPTPRPDLAKRRRFGSRRIEDGRQLFTKCICRLKLRTIRK